MPVLQVSRARSRGWPPSGPGPPGRRSPAERGSGRRRPGPYLRLSSTVAASAIPFSTMEIASRHSACCSRLARNPGTSFLTWTGCLPMARWRSIVNSMTQGAVSAVCTTSTSGMRNGGFHQCVPMILSRRSRLAGDLRGTHDGGVGGQHGLGRAHLVEVVEDLLLERHVFDDGLEHEIRVGDRVFHDQRGGHAVQRRLHVLEPAQTPLGQEGQVLAHVRHDLGQRLRHDVVQDDVVARAGEDHRAAGAHHAGAEYRDLPDVFQSSHPATAPPSTERTSPVT